MTLGNIIIPNYTRIILNSSLVLLRSVKNLTSKTDTIIFYIHYQLVEGLIDISPMSKTLYSIPAHSAVSTLQLSVVANDNPRQNNNL